MLLVTVVDAGAGSHWSAAAELSPNDFAAVLDKLATEVLGNQLRAVIALRQPELRILSDPTGLGRDVLTAQARNARAARHFLGTIQPRMALLVAEATSLGEQMRDLNQTLAETPDPQDAAEALARILEEMRTYESCTREGLAMARTSVDITDNTARMLQKAIDRTSAATGDKDARIARARIAVERTEKTISDAVQAMIGESDISGAGIGGRTIGGPAGAGPAGSAAGSAGIRDIATALVSRFGGMARALPRDSGAIAEFPVETITTITSDALGQGPAPQAIRDGNALLQDQYQALAGFGAMLAAAQIIRGQTVELAEAASRLARITGETDATLATVIASVEALRTRLGKGETVAVIAAELDAAMFAWTRLIIRTREIGRTLSGVNLLFPEA